MGRLTPLLGLLLLGCRDERLVPFADALTAWDAGRARLAAGAPAEAATSFAEARGFDAQSPALVLWEAKARADAGDLPAAITLLDTVLDRSPELALARYNRAAYHARQGNLDAAAADLRVALAAEIASPYAAAEDPDFAPHRAAAAFSGLLPALPAVGRAVGPEGAVWIGSRVEVRLVLESLARSTIVVRRDGADPGCLALEQIVEDDVERADVRLREVTLRLSARGPCRGALGPFVAVVDGVEVPLGGVEVLVEAPPGTPPASVTLPATVVVPSMFAPDGSEVRTGPVPGGTAALGPLDTVLTAGGAAPAYTLEWRMNGQTRAQGGVWAGSVEVKGRKRQERPRPE